jgi:hypothetical protein
MFFSAFLGALIAFVGLLATMGLILAGLIKKDKKRFRQAGLIFVATFSLLVIIALLEFLLIVIIFNHNAR